MIVYIGRGMSSGQNILLTNSTEIYGGGEFYVFELARALQQRHYEVTVCCKPNNLLRTKSESAAIPVVPLDFPNTGRLGAFTRSLQRIIAERHVHLIHTNSNYDRTAGAFAARLTGIKHVTNVHSFHSIQHNITQWLRNRLATDHFIVDGVCVRDLLLRDDHIPPQKISVVHLGVDPDIMKRDAAARKLIRKEFGVADDTKIVGNVGRLVPMKGQEFLIRAFATVAAEFARAILFIVGDGELMGDLKALADELRIGSRVIFAGFRDDLPAVYSAFDMYVHSSIEGGGETFPFAVLQALAHELPVVATRVGDVAEMVEDGVNGFLVPDRTDRSLADSITGLLRNRDLCDRMGSGSHDRFLLRFTQDRMVDNIVYVYNSVLGP